MPLMDGDDLVPSLNTGSESTSMLSSHHTLTLHQPPLLYHATGISSVSLCALNCNVQNIMSLRPCEGEGQFLSF